MQGQAEAKKCVSYKKKDVYHLKAHTTLFGQIFKYIPLFMILK